MFGFNEKFFGPSEKPGKKEKDIELENLENLSTESLRYRNMEKIFKISDMDGVKDFTESPDGVFISYTTSHGKSLKVYNRQSGIVQTLCESENKRGDYGTNISNKLKTYRLGDKFAVGYSRKGKFFMQELSHGTLPGTVILEWEGIPLYESEGILSKDQKTLISQNLANKLDFTDLDSGDVTSFELDFISSKLIDSENGSLGMVIDEHNLLIFNKDKKSLLKKLEKKEPLKSAAFIDDNSFVISQNDELVFYNLKNGNYEEGRRLTIGFDSDEIITSIDGSHLFCRSISQGKFFVIEKETGKIVHQIDSQRIQQNWKGELAALNSDGAIEQYRLRSTPSKEERTQKIMIVGGEPVYNQGEYSQFIEIQEETIKGAHWHVYKNLISRQLEKQRKFEWGKQRLYIEIPTSEFEQMKDIVIEIAGSEQIPIQFKFLDMEKTDPEIAQEKTRFVLNFKDLSDAKKFYKLLSNNEYYKNITPDRNQDYHGYKLDDRTTYASGFTEFRKEDLQNLQNLKDNFTKNSDGAYTSKIPNIESGERETLSQEEYEDLINEKDPVLISKNNWEK